MDNKLMYLAWALTAFYVPLATISSPLAWIFAAPVLVYFLVCYALFARDSAYITGALNK